MQLSLRASGTHAAVHDWYTLSFKFSDWHALAGLQPEWHYQTVAANGTGSDYRATGCANGPIAPAYDAVPAAFRLPVLPVPKTTTMKV
jgi:hypothetical protein